ncbi:MAG: hypothetical protein ACJAZM_002811 [Cyclobacteriaceae bacterium]
MTACQNHNNYTAFNYGTQNDSARLYFEIGWSEIMDNGRWTASETAFRKAVILDTTWLLGLSMVGRITRSLPERQTILAKLERRKNLASPYERMLLDVNMMSLKAANNRKLGVTNTEEFSQKRSELALTNLGKFIEQFPADNYFKAEYIEHLHASFGAEAALDSLRKLARPEQMSLGFYVSYAANLELEMGHIEAAKSHLATLQSIMPDTSHTSPLMLQAQIFLAQDSLLLAKALIDQVVRIDSNHMIATGMQSRFNTQ